MIPTDRTLYLEVAKLRRHDRQWVKKCLANVKRCLDKEKSHTANVTPSNFDEIGW